MKQPATAANDAATHDHAPHTTRLVIAADIPQELAGILANILGDDADYEAWKALDATIRMWLEESDAPFSKALYDSPCQDCSLVFAPAQE